MLGQFTGKDESYTCLDFAGGDSRLLRICGELCVNALMGDTPAATRNRTRGLSGNSLEDIVDKRVQNGHSLVGNTRVRVNLLQHCQRRVRMDSWSGVFSRRTLVDVGAVGLFASLLALLLFPVNRSAATALAGGLLRGLGSISLGRSLGGSGCRGFASGGCGLRRRV